MLYRKMGNLDWQVSALGFGAMRLPVLKSWDQIDEEKAGKMLRYAIDMGVNYVDTAWVYHEENSELFLGRALKDGYREKVKLVTKSPIWLVDSRKSFRTFLERQLKKLDTGFLDIYLLHGISDEKWERVKQLHLVDELELLRKEGIINHIGFSFHGSPDVFKEIIDFHPWDTAMIQYNYLDTDFQATEKGLDYAYLKNVAVVVMEPLRGGKLVQSSAPIEQILTEAPIKRTLAEWAFRFIWNHPGVSTVLSGMSTMEQVKENIRYAQEAFPNSFGDDDFTIISRLKESYLSKLKVPCTNCHYCMPCPEGVDIPENFNLINHAAWEGGVKNWIKKWYDELDDPDIASDWHGKGKASKCIQCGECVDKCPQNIDIPAVLEEMTAIFEGSKSLS